MVKILAKKNEGREAATARRRLALQPAAFGERHHLIAANDQMIQRADS
ncbi:hypothetical protein [Dickeya chrysanthemi]